MKAEPPTSLGNLSEEICQNTILQAHPDTLDYQWFANLDDRSRFLNFENNVGKASGFNHVFYAIEDTLTGCFSKKATFTLSVLPADSGKLNIKTFAYCTEDTLSLFVLDDVFSYHWFQNDSSLTSIGDSLYIDQKTNRDTSFLFQISYENGCFSSIEKINIKIESCLSGAVIAAIVEINSSEIKGFGCSTYPNPFSANDNIELITENMIFEEVSIFDSQGFKVEHKWTNEQNQKLSLDSELNTGVYILKILDINGNHCEWKMVKNM